MARFRTSVALAGTLTCLLWASVAWACTPSAGADLVTSGVVKAGGTATVRIWSFNAAPVSIRWNSPDGIEVGHADGPADTVTVDIPAGLDSDVYHLVATQSGSSNPAVTIEVVGATSPARPAQPTEPRTGEDLTPRPQSASETARPEAPSPTPAQSVSGSGEGGGVTGVAPRSTPAAGATRSRAVTAGPGPIRSDPGAAPAPAGSTAGSTAATPGGVTAPAAPSGDAAAPAPRPWSDDVASGFASGRRPAPSLHSSPAGAGSGRSGQALAALVLVSVAMVGSAGAALAVSLRRRRVTVPGSSTSHAGDLP